MILPKFTQNPSVEKSIPALDGGLNVSKAPWLIEDNELTDGCNIWLRDGTLRTRPAFTTSAAWRGTEETDSTIRYCQDRNGWLVSVSSTLSGGSDILTVTAREPNGGAVKQLLYQYVPPRTTFACVAAGGSVGAYTLLLYTSEGRVWALDPVLGKADEMTDRFYVPTVSVNGIPAAQRQIQDSGNEPYQQRNRLTDRVRCCYTPDGIGTYYYLPYRNIEGEVRIRVSGVAGSVHEYVIPAEKTVSETAAKKKAVLERYNGMFYFKDEEGENTALIDYGMRNSVVAECHVPFDDPLVFDMTFGTWYGGDKNSTGGQRLILCGNATHTSTLVWSVAENPFYFPENACTTVGVSGQAVTAFGKQDGHLVLFKEHEVYTAECIRGGADAEDTAQAVFPIYAIHTEIGCDLPDTVALFGNRLTWASRDGHVYQLARPNLSGSRNILTVSDAIHPLLCETYTGALASARVWEGRYCLLYGRNIWILHEGEHPVWYRWQWHDLSLLPCSMYVYGSRLFILAKSDITGGGDTFWFTVQGDCDVFPLEGYREQPIRGMVCTKVFDFGMPQLYKRTVRVAMHSKTPLAPVYITERGEYRDRTHCPDTGELVVCTPNVTRCRRLSLRFEREGLDVGDLTIQMRAERGIRW